ncbi:hypothetical protein GCM10010211_75240 [Streptomyces albospinus]|uniref:Glycosyltransferase 2-like domain-containing protein n=1 Tax=Streptomyces albospinus TaxID=285515 RepID=A0ABQ2VLX7_9ACTN|nr:glycosyltransferase [Streptomyces albospinus]GGU96838.1 hypothetical protein GCM10010211_75240 [Streptomyces albospinus]
MTAVFPKVVVVVPTYNERDNLPVLAGLLADLPVPNLHLLVVDDSSPDGTGEVADNLAAESPDAVGVLHRTAKDGLGRAYLAGMTRALSGVHREVAGHGSGVNDELGTRAGRRPMTMA